MDPIAIAILTALVAGVGESLFAEAYNALKNALKKKHGAESNVVTAVERLEATPHSLDQQSTVVNELDAVDASKDSELLQLAQVLLATIRQTPEGGRLIRKFDVYAVDSQIGVIGDNISIEGGIHFGS